MTMPSPPPTMRTRAPTEYLAIKLVHDPGGNADLGSHGGPDGCH